MSTLDDIEAAAAALPPEQKQELLLFLAEHLRREGARVPEEPPLAFRRSQRGFPISRGRVPFSFEDVVRLEADADFSP